MITETAGKTACPTWTLSLFGGGAAGLAGSLFP